MNISINVKIAFPDPESCTSQSGERYGCEINSTEIEQKVCIHVPQMPTMLACGNTCIN